MADYELTFIIPEEHAIRARDGISGHFGNGMLEGESKADYVHRKMRLTMKMWVLKYERRVKQDAIVDDPIDIN